MARISRDDEPGAWHHVMNRGLSRRALFEDRADVRYFLSRLARESRRGRLTIHSWCILTTHFHLLVETPTGELSASIRDIQTSYSRFYNRRHKRDGPLIKGRFTSRRIRSDAYQRLLLGYINRNPVTAGIAQKPQDYPWCSAHAWASSQIPKWLSQTWLTHETATATTSMHGSALVEASFSHPGKSQIALDDLIHSAPPQVQNWMQKKAKLADGTEVGLPVCNFESILLALHTNLEVSREHAQSRDDLSIKIGLLRTLSSMSWIDIAKQTNSSTSSCQRRFYDYQKHMQRTPIFAARAGELARAALDLCHGQ